MATSDPYGQGLAFPFDFDIARGSLKLVSGVECVQDDFLFLLATDLGERIMRPTIGGRLSQGVFQLDNPEQQALLKAWVLDVARQEPRIRSIASVTFTHDPSDTHIMNITIAFIPQSRTDLATVVIPIYRG